MATNRANNKQTGHRNNDINIYCIIFSIVASFGFSDKAIEAVIKAHNIQQIIGIIIFDSL
jgi:hypothetical protein